jgi:magnesium transporter
MQLKSSLPDCKTLSSFDLRSRRNAAHDLCTNTLCSCYCSYTHYTKHTTQYVSRHIVIALFLTMLTGTAGNAGNQSSAMVIRGLATGEIHKGNKMKCLAREGKAALAAAVILSAASFARVLMTPGSTMLATIAVSVAMGATVVGAVLFGTATPLLLDRFGIDPVNFASPALATLTDVSGVLILCTVASALLRGTP